MSKKTSALIAVLFLITCGLLFLAVITTPQTPKKAAAVIPSPTPTLTNAKTTLSLVDAPPTQVLRKNTTIAVAIDTANNVNAVQLELSYDPSKITNITLSPGTYFQQPNVLLKSIDPANGRISYALGEQVDLPGKSGKGTVAFLSFTLVPSATPATTTISFLPKTAATADKITESVLKSTNDITLSLPVMNASGSANQSTPSAK